MVTTIAPAPCDRAIELFDGEGLPLTAVAMALGCSETRAAHQVVLGRLKTGSGLTVLPRECSRHLSGFLLPTPATRDHHARCTHCQLLLSELASPAAAPSAPDPIPGTDPPARTPDLKVELRTGVPQPPTRRQRRVAPLPPPPSSLAMPPLPIEPPPPPKAPPPPPPAASWLATMRVGTERAGRSRTAWRVIAVLVAVAAIGLTCIALAPSVVGATTSAVRHATAAWPKPVAEFTPPARSDLRVGDPYYPGTWDTLAACASGGTWHQPPSGGLGLSAEQWRRVGGSGQPSEASRAEQLRRAIALWELDGWEPWADCADQLGWR